MDPSIGNGDVTIGVILWGAAVLADLKIAVIHARSSGAILIKIKFVEKEDIWLEDLDDFGDAAGLRVVSRA